MKDFIAIIPFEEIKDVFRSKLGKREGNKKYRTFEKWMSGQTCAYNGVYECDLDRFLKGLPVID